VSQTADAIVVGAGIVGAFCADALTAAGLRVVVVDRGTVAGGTSGSGEGNILVSDKELGPELDLALLSNELWRGLPEDLRHEIELEYKGGLVVAATEAGMTAVEELAKRQRAAGVTATDTDVDQAHEIEPYLTHDMVGAMHYPQDMQVQPMLATAAILRRARAGGANVLTHTRVTAVQRGANGQITGVQTPKGAISAPVVINAAGPWSGELAALAGSSLPVMPRRGFILVTEPLPIVVRSKVYDADYVANVASGDAALQTSTVVEGTASGTILIGATRERVGFDTTVRLEPLKILAQQAIRLFPVLAGVRAMRAYCGFRPYCPDHLPVISEDTNVPGLFHAAGHEGAGIGLAPGTGALISALATGSAPPLDPTPFQMDRPGLLGNAKGSKG
jgi:glycine/D-amino acid oxidase-like deaminating enzyme